MAGTDVLMGKRGTHQHAEGVWTIGGAGNSLVVDHGDGLLMVDSGPGREVTDAMIVALREISDKPLTHIVISMATWATTSASRSGTPMRAAAVMPSRFWWAMSGCRRAMHATARRPACRPT